MKKYCFQVGKKKHNKRELLIIARGSLNRNENENKRRLL